MITPINALIIVMLLSNNVWAIYGVFLDARQTCSNCNVLSSTLSIPANSTALVSRTTSLEISFSSLKIPATASFLPPHNVSGPLSTSTIRSTLVASQQPPFRTGPPASTAEASSGLSPQAKIGIGVAGGILGLVLVFALLFDACYLRRKRRERDVQYALNEVEGGTVKESQERIVLESRVSIVFEEEEEEEEEGYEGELEDDADDEDEEDRGRNGMSLPRRMMS
ncbi:hypothetical protein BDV96DRAFT_630984 [Lophiotrema nucula]|uniref:Mid2 domain-containing protein n=1 Tax=Lophiotrema nucula TaxID=690887 RepID=A0A6A5ZAW0_9PLEO|nr:hypothetical protein BDV96DRAFT_630984 [Lophiotrema nucula]